jgi:cyclopropane-fatty-acyl-phospholipid synthase
MDHQNFTYYRKNPDFIQRYIFPGGMLPSVPVFESHAEKVGLKLERREFFGHHYVQTLSHWLERVDRSAEHIEALGYDRRFLRMWRFYLAYCFAGFRGGLIDLMQCRMTRA